MRCLIGRGIRILLSLVAAQLAGAAGSQEYPSKPVTIVLVLVPGTGLDLVARTYGDKLAQSLGRPAVFDNRPGERTARSRCAEESSRRRARAVGGDQRRVGAQPDHLQAAPVRFGEGFHPGLALSQVAVHPSCIRRCLCTRCRSWSSS